MKILWLLASIAVMGWGALNTFAFMMSDNPAEAQADSNKSCLLAIGGIVSLIACIAVWVWG